MADPVRAGHYTTQPYKGTGPRPFDDRGPVASIGRRASHLSQTARRRLAFEHQTPWQRSCLGHNITNANDFHELVRVVKKLQMQTFLVE